MTAIFLPIFVLISVSALTGADLADVARARSATDARAIVGTDAGPTGWLFTVHEMRHLAKGEFWGAASAQTAVNPRHADPEVALLRFHRELASLGITLILVPVPAKAVIYPDRLDAALPLPTAPIATNDVRFADRLRSQGLIVIGLDAAFIAARREDATLGPLYCASDTHWAPRGAQLAAGLVCAAIRNQSWYPALPPTAFTVSAPAPCTFTGNLCEPGGPTETVLMSTAVRDDSQPLFARSAPIILMGDSHTMVFTDGGEMLARGGGFADHLAAGLGQPLDRIANKGGASAKPRNDLYRLASKDPTWIAGKKAVVYCFTVREFTEAINGWPAQATTAAFDMPGQGR